MGGRGDGDKLPEDVLGHFDVVVGNDQCLLNVLVGVPLTHEVLDLTGELRRSSSSPATLLTATCSSFRVDSPGKRFGGPLRNLGVLSEVCCGIAIQ